MSSFSRFPATPLLSIENPHMKILDMKILTIDGLLNV